MRILVAALLFLALLAGCSGNDGGTGTETMDRAAEFGYPVAAFGANGLPVPLALCFPMLPGEEALHAGTSRCNFLMTPDDGRQGNEVTIAVNPQDPRQVVGGAKDYYPADAGQCVWDGVYVTHDGGRTAYEDRSFDGSPWRLTTDPSTFKPNYASQYWCTTDPVAYYSQDGKALYYLLMAYQGDPVTASKACENVCPQGAVNDWAFNRAIQIVAISHDGGDSFDTFTGVFEGTYPVAFHDKGWVAASNDGVIHVMWLASAAPGNLYFRSTDKGQSYTDPFIMASTLEDSGQGSFVDVGPGQEVYAAWTGASINLRRSLDEGATWLPTQAILQPHIDAPPGLSDRDRRGGSPALATDRNPDSPLANSVYFVWQDTCSTPAWSADCEQGRSNIYFVASHDGGATFGTPVRIDEGLDTEHFFPAVSVSPGGVIDVQWMDEAAGTAASPDAAGSTDPHPRIQQRYTYSLDGGQTWSTPLALRDAPDEGWDPGLSHHQDGKIFFGDYQDIDSSWHAAHPVWPDTRDGKDVKVYTATLQRPMWANGWDPAKRAALEQAGIAPL